MSVVALLGDGDRRPRAVRRHIDVVRLDDQACVWIALLLQHDLRELGIVVRRLQPRVALGLRRIAADVDEGVLGVDAEILVALQRDETADVGDAVARVGRRRPAGEALPTEPDRASIFAHVEARRSPVLQQSHDGFGFCGQKHSSPRPFAESLHEQRHSQSTIGTSSEELDGFGGLSTATARHAHWRARAVVSALLEWASLGRA
jgi:hypothetical protein